MFLYASGRQIEEALYNVHRYFFERDSAHFRTLLDSVQGADEKSPIVLPYVKCSSTLR